MQKLQPPSQKWRPALSDSAAPDRGLFSAQSHSYTRASHSIHLTTTSGLTSMLQAPCTHVNLEGHLQESCFERLLIERRYYRLTGYTASKNGGMKASTTCPAFCLIPADTGITCRVILHVMQGCQRINLKPLRVHHETQRVHESTINNQVEKS